MASRSRSSKITCVRFAGEDPEQMTAKLCETLGNISFEDFAKGNFVSTAEVITGD